MVAINVRLTTIRVALILMEYYHLLNLIEARFEMNVIEIANIILKVCLEVYFTIN